MKNIFAKIFWAFLVSGAILAFSGCAEKNAGNNKAIIAGDSNLKSATANKNDSNLETSKNENNSNLKDSAADDDLSEFEGEYQKNDFDPLSGYNRVMTSFNDFLYRNVFTPVFVGYDYVMPDEGQKAIASFFDNLLFPIRFINNILQFKFKNAGEETLRFIANTIVGFAGISDVATKYYHIPRHDEDFGQTLGHWGIGGGFPVVLPILGQSNLRDMFGLVGDAFTNPITYSGRVTHTDRFWTPMAIGIFNKINEGSLDPYRYENITKDAVDLYPFLKSAYEQMRDAKIKE